MESRPVLLVRGLGNDRDAQALASHGISTISESFTEITVGNKEEALHLLQLAATVEGWVIATSRNAIDFWSALVGAELLSTKLKENPALKFAAIGLGSSEALNSLGIRQVSTPPKRNSQGLLELLLSYPPSQAIIPLGNLARRTLPEGLLQMGWTIHAGLVYNNVPMAVVPTTVNRILDGDFSALLLRSPSAAFALAHFLPNASVPLVCGDESTAQAARELALNVVAVADDPSPDTIAKLVARTLKEKP